MVSKQRASNSATNAPRQRAGGGRNAPKGEKKAPSAADGSNANESLRMKISADDTRLDRQEDQPHPLEVQQRIAKLDARLAERFNEIATLTQLLREREREVSRMSCELISMRTAAGVEVGRAVLHSVELSTFWRLLPRAIQVSRKTALLKRSNLFDRVWYLGYYKDVANAGVDPARHYIEYGAAEGRLPRLLSAEF